MTIFLELAKFCSMHTLEMCGDIFQPGEQLETPGLVDIEKRYSSHEMSHLMLLKANVGK